MKTVLEELQESWKRRWPRESLLRPELAVVEETVPIPVQEESTKFSTNVNQIAAKKDIEKRGGKRGPHRVTGMNTIERRRAVLKMMKEHPEMNSMQIAKELGESRGTVWHDILYIREKVPELNSFARKKKVSIQVQE